MTFDNKHYYFNFNKDEQGRYMFKIKLNYEDFDIMD